VGKAKALNWVQGYGDGYFRPEKSISRAEALKVVLEAFEQKINPKSRSSFQDVNKSAWYSPYIAKAETLGFLTETQKFRPDEQATRAEVVEWLVKIERLQSTDK
jgi:hypothetical protein